jgi:hypothetical protein
VHRERIPLAALALATALALSCASASGPTTTEMEREEKKDDSSYVGEIEKWRALRVERLRREDGWLSLVGLFWLKPGVNVFGGDPGNRVVFPKGSSPGLMGTLRLEKGVVSVRVNPSVPVTHEGRLVRNMVLKTDADGDPTILRYKSLMFHVIKRGDRVGVRVKDADSPARRNFTGIETFPIDPAWRLQAHLSPYDQPKKMSVPNILGTPTEETSPGAIVFEVEGQTYRLDPVNEEGSEELFVIFGDKTNGHETYGGGRFLYAPRPGPDGKLVLDFNRSYNPPCVFTPYATCPLPPPQNKLPVRIAAGEKAYGEH